MSVAANEDEGAPRNLARPGHREPHAHATPQPFTYPLQRSFVEPDWTRLPGWASVSAAHGPRAARRPPTTPHYPDPRKEVTP